MEFTRITIDAGQKLSAVFPSMLAEGHKYQAACLIIPQGLSSGVIYFNGAMTADGDLFRVKQVGLPDDYFITPSVGWVPLDLDVFSTQPFLQLEVDVSEGAEREFYIGIRVV